jgi:formamidopyrimidine-DNA glycosylase
VPELPEVETTRRGVAPALVGRRVAAVHVYDRRLRWPVPDDLERELQGRELIGVDRRSKYLLFRWAPRGEDPAPLRPARGRPAAASTRCWFTSG